MPTLSKAELFGASVDDPVEKERPPVKGAKPQPTYAAIVAVGVGLCNCGGTS